MKKKIALSLAVIMVIAILAGCSAKYAADSAYVTGGSSANTSYYAMEESKAAYAEAPTAEASFDFAQESGIAANAAGSESIDYSEKLIYSASAHIETTKFDDSVQQVYDMIEFYHAYLESSYITGQNYSSKARGYQPYRSASFTIRVPQQGYKNLTQNLEIFGNVVSVYESVDNITQQFYDSKSRLDTYKIEEERVLAMLEKADNVPDMIELESRLSDIRYNIESIESRLRVWQNQVDYSTVTLDIEEVAEYTEIVQPQRTYWQQIGDGFKSSLKGVGRFFKDLFKDFVTALPVLVLLAAAVLIIVLIVRKVLRTRRVKRAQLRAEKAKTPEEGEKPTK